MPRSIDQIDSGRPRGSTLFTISNSVHSADATLHFDVFFNSRTETAETEHRQWQTLFSIPLTGGYTPLVAVYFGRIDQCDNLTLIRVAGHRRSDAYQSQGSIQNG